VHCDLDGIAGKVLSKYFVQEFDDYIILDYNFERTDEVLKNRILEFDYIVFSDFCPPKEFIENLLSLNKVVYIYDHHDSSEWIKEINHKNLVVVHDLNRCGTKIYYEEFIKPQFNRIPKIVNDLVKLVDTYDLWKLNDPLWEEAQNLNRVLYKVIDWNSDFQNQWESFIDLILRKLYNCNEWMWTDYEQKLIKIAIDKENKIYNESNNMLQKRVDEKGNKFGIFKASSKISIVCSRLLKEHLDLEYIICINTFKLAEQKEFRLSVRSREFDCTQLEGVEGHKEAAALVLDKFDMFNDLLNGKINSIKYKIK
jgi:oligoribonuclease NrnB/cAMP/cGMP phosphodiesterase (DHH superfamily)